MCEKDFREALNIIEKNSSWKELEGVSRDILLWVIGNGLWVAYGAAYLRGEKSESSEE